jgi:hypothetical protein
MNYGKRKGQKSKTLPRSAAADQAAALRRRSFAKDTTGPGVMQEVPRDRAAPLARPMKRRPKMNVQTGKYVSN